MEPLARVSSASVSVDLIRGILHACEALGIPQRELLTAMGTTPHVVATDDARVPQAAFDRIWLHLGERFPENPMGLRVAERIGNAADSWVAQLALLSRNLEEAMTALVRFCRLFAEGETLIARNTRVGREFELIARSLPSRAARHLYEFGLGRVMIFARHVVGGSLMPVSAIVRRRPHRDPVFDRVFGPHVRFDGPRYALTIPNADLARPSVKSQPKLRKLVQEKVDVLAESLPQAGGMSLRVRHTLVTLLPVGRGTLQELARACGVSNRTLQRRLDDEGTTFAAVLDDVRYALARDLLKQPGSSIATAAGALGFSSHASFHAAFCRWAGMTPGQFRAKKNSR